MDMMRLPSILAITTCLLIICFCAKGQDVAWVTHYSDTSNAFGFVDIREQPDGDIIVAGEYSTITFQGTTYQSNGYSYGFLACYGADGTEKWIKFMDGDDYGEAYPTDMDIDAAGNIYIIARGQSFIYDGASLMFEDNGYMLFKTDPEGNLLWHDSQYTESSLDDRNTGYIDLNDIAVSDDGEIYLVSTLYDDYQHASGLSFINDYSYVELLLIAYNADGTTKWLREGDSGLDFNGDDLHLVQSANGHLTLGGTYNYDVTTYTLSFGGTPLPEGQFDDGVFVAQFDNNGNELWLKSFNDNEIAPEPSFREKNEALTSLSVEGDQVNMTISFTDELVLGGTVLSNQSSMSSDRDMALVQLDATGSVNWYQYFTGRELRMNVAANPTTGDIGIVGLYEELSFVGADEYLFDGFAVSDYFIAHFDRAGSLVSLDTTEYASTIDRISFSWDQYAPIAFLTDNSLAAGFRYGGRADVAFGSFTFSEAGSALAKFNPKEAINLNVDLGQDVIQCGGTVTLNAGLASTYEWSTGAVSRTITVSSSGTYSVTVFDEEGNSGTDEINVTIESPIVYQLPASMTGFGSVTITAEVKAYAYEWTTGETTQSIRLTESGTIGLTVFTEGGCETYSETSVEVTVLSIYQGGSGIGYDKASTELTAFAMLGGAGIGYDKASTEPTAFAMLGGPGIGYSTGSMPITTLAIHGGSGIGYSHDSTSTTPWLFAGGAGKGYDVAFLDYMQFLLSTHQDALAVQLSIFPNPAVNTLNIAIDNVEGRVNIAIYNTEGKLMLSLNESQLNQKVDVSKLLSGFYVVEVEPLDMAIKNVSRTKLILTR